MDNIDKAKKLQIVLIPNLFSPVAWDKVIMKTAEEQKKREHFYILRRHSPKRLSISKVFLTPRTVS